MDDFADAFLIASVCFAVEAAAQGAVLELAYTGDLLIPVLPHVIAHVA